MAKDPTGQLYRAGALLFGLGALTGLLVSASFSGKISGSPQFMLAAHLNALMGCFWLFCVGVSWDRLSLKPAHARLLLRSTVLAAYANWAVTIAKSVLEVQGIDYVGDISNDTIFGLLTLTVVIPTLLSSGLWVRGLWRSERA